MRLLIVPTTIILLAFSVACNPCQEEVSFRDTQPGGSILAVIAIRECGATTGSNTLLYLHRDTLIPWDSEDDVIIGIEDPQWLQAKWVDHDSILVTRLKDVPPEKIFKQSTESRGIKISYTVVPR